MKRIIAIADIHGCLDRFNRLLDKIGPSPENDKLVFLGDFIDRGPDSPGVLDRVLELDRAGFETVTLRGNHEQMLDNFLSGKLAAEFYRINGGTATLKAYRRRGFELPEQSPPPEHVRFLAQLKPWHREGDYVFAHAGLRPGVPLSEQRSRDLYWIREEFFNAEVDWGYKIVFGHTPFGRPHIKNGLFGIDTGAVYGGRLTALLLPDEEFIGV